MWTPATCGAGEKVNCLNTKKKIFYFYAISFLLLLLGSIIWTIGTAKLDTEITVSYLFKKNIVLNLLVCLFFASCKKVGVVAAVALFALSSFCLAFPIIRSVKKKKVFPYNLIFIIFLGAYFFSRISLLTFYQFFFSLLESCCFFRSSTIFTNHSTIAGS